MEAEGRVAKNRAALTQLIAPSPYVETPVPLTLAPGQRIVTFIARNNGADEAVRITIVPDRHDAFILANPSSSKCQIREHPRPTGQVPLCSVVRVATRPNHRSPTANPQPVAKHQPLEASSSRMTTSHDGPSPLCD